MRTDLFDYELPPGRIAQEPVPQRDEARLLVLRADACGVEHRRFSDLPSVLHAGDLLVLNDTRVLPARLRAVRATGGAVEMLLLSPLGDGAERRWRALVKPARRVRPGEILVLLPRSQAGSGDCAMAESGGRVSGIGDAAEVEVVEADDDGSRVVALPRDPALEKLLDVYGSMPLPPYIRRGEGDPREAVDRERYQTVYAEEVGAIAAPTAGLHFTDPLLDRLREAGVEVARITLHVGIGTFRPVATEHVEEHTMDGERASVPAGTIDAIARARARRGRVVAVGTTVVRTLEDRAASHASLESGSGEATIFIRPGHRFRVVDAMLTNFHLPRSTPLLMVAALAGRERVLSAYEVAVREGYRFYSYGDSMLVLP